jgi:hypothetical protein
MDKLRPQLQLIYYVLATVLETRWSDTYVVGSDLRVIQHLSAACRASRVESLKGLGASKMLSLLDDKDIALCRSKRLSTWGEIGFFCCLTLAIPSRIHDANVIVQKISLDLIFPIFWMFFFLMNYFMYVVSVGLLLAFYVISLALMFYFMHLAKQDWWKQYVGSMPDPEQDNLEIDVNKMGGGLGQKQSSWDKMNNVIAEESELTGFNFDMVEYDENLAQQNYTFPQFPGKKDKTLVKAKDKSKPPPLLSATATSTESAQKKSRRPTMLIREMEAAREAKKQAGSKEAGVGAATEDVEVEVESDSSSSSSSDDGVVVPRRVHVKEHAV